MESLYIMLSFRCKSRYTFDWIRRNQKWLMEDPLLNKTEHNVDVTIIGDTSSNDEHIVNITTDDRSLSTHEQTPHEAEGVELCVPCTEENVMNLIDFVFTLVQIVAAIVVVTRAVEKHPEAALFIWIIGYTCASIASLLFLCCQLWYYSVSLDTRYNLFLPFPLFLSIGNQYQ